jgi:hypothetical protein
MTCSKQNVQRILLHSHLTSLRLWEVLDYNSVWLLLPIQTPSCCKIDYWNITMFPTEGRLGMWGGPKAKIVKTLKRDSANSFCYCNEGAHCKNQQDVFDLHA